MSLYMRLFAWGGWFDRQSWQHQIWIRTKRYDICIGRLPHRSSEPWGIWIGKDGVRHYKGRYAPKHYAWTWEWYTSWFNRTHPDPTIPAVIPDEPEPQ